MPFDFTNNNVEVEGGGGLMMIIYVNGSEQPN